MDELKELTNRVVQAHIDDVVEDNGRPIEIHVNEVRKHVSNFPYITDKECDDSGKQRDINTFYIIGDLLCVFKTGLISFLGSKTGVDTFDFGWIKYNVAPEEIAIFFIGEHEPFEPFDPEDQDG